MLRNTLGLSAKALAFGENREGIHIGENVAGLPSSELSPATRQRLEKQVAEHPIGLLLDSGEIPTPQVTLRSDRFMPGVSPVGLLILPDGGEAKFSPVSTLAFLLFLPSGSPASAEPAVELPTAWTEHALLLSAVEKLEDLDAVLAAMSGARLTSLWLEVPPVADRAQALLARVIPLAKEKGIAVRAYVRPWRFPTNGIPDGSLLDRNVFGETSAEFAERVAKSPDSFGFQQELSETASVRLAPTVSNTALVADALAKIAATPGLSGLVVGELYPPGYVGDRMEFGQSLGFTAGARLNYLEKAGIDPIDLGREPNPNTFPPAFTDVPISYEYDPGGGLARVSSPTPPSALWKRHLKESVAPARAAVFSKLRTAAPALPILLAEGDYRVRFASWDAEPSRPSPARKPTLSVPLSESGAFLPFLHEALQMKAPGLQGMVLQPWRMSSAQIVAGLKRFGEQVR